MRIFSSPSGGLPALLPMVGLLLLALAAPASADSLYRDHAYADSFGNLVVYSPSGYKAIIVGGAHSASRVSGAAESGEPGIVRLRREPGKHFHRHRGDCAVLLHGRSYMYGLPDNVVPMPAKYCG